MDPWDAGWTLFTRGSLDFGQATKVLLKAFGRGGIFRHGGIVVRPYRRGGLIRHVNERLYFSPERFAQEFAVHLALWTSGFPTVEPLGYGYRRRLWGVEGIYLTRFVEAQAWPSCWERSAELLPQLTVMLNGLVAWGLHAPDLNATNLLIDGDGKALALDWDRSRWIRADDLRARYRERLLRSLKKLRAPEQVLTEFMRSCAG